MQQLGLTSWRRRLYLLARVVYRRVPVVRRFAPRSLTRLASERAPSVQSDRLYLERCLLPVFASGRYPAVLFVGVQRYTGAYGRRFRRSGTEYWTMDIDPRAATWGEPGRHVTGDVTEAHRLFASGSFAAVLLNGVFGFGVDDPATMEAALTSLHGVLHAGGVLLVGWNRGRVVDPLELRAARELYVHEAPADFPARIEFADSTHVFDFLVAIEAPTGRPTPTRPRPRSWREAP